MNNKEQDYLQKDLFRFSVAHNLGQVLSLIYRGAKADHENSEAFRHAAAKGNLSIIKYLHSQNASVASNDFEALRWSASEGHYDTVEWLIDQGSNIDTCLGWPLERSAENGHFKIVNLLLAKGADISKGDYSSIFSAARKDRYDMVNHLISILDSRQFEEFSVLLNTPETCGTNLGHVRDIVTSRQLNEELTEQTALSSEQPDDYVNNSKFGNSI
ncbi:MAG: ankyrin repeat domain-containing protein [Endozoicomonadaceae bacterium]|nr:ankyrin repeat domain-containing protein [Endozoicomonadaceae bacterium]